MVTTVNQTVPGIVLKDFLNRQMKLRGRLPSQFARDLGVSHPTVGRWLTGEDVPNTKCCQLIANLTGEPVVRILKMAGHLPADFDIEQPTDLPPFREYIALKYPDKLSESIVLMIERELYSY